ncbi:hypothetical protein ANANG_G00277650 [Anguilla anguilla]|uniref:Uncharacterized protein n=1 Tax=Anguilla anguilla TaxID=7936 RepID=A0A9D3LVU9_ANGAN|nr:hypothetical protein ANANG_G00277650 [Anguilla anguilla]
MSKYVSIEDTDTTLLKKWRPLILRSGAHTSVWLNVMLQRSVSSLYWTVLGDLAESGKEGTTGPSPETTRCNSSPVELKRLRK